MNLPPAKNKNLKILILSAPIGSGHRMAAAALEEALLRLDHVEVVQGNVFDFFPGVIGKAFLKFYETVLTVCPWLYALSYRWSNRDGGSLWMRNLLNGILLRLGKPFIEEVKPDAVFSTHATPTGILSLYKQKYDANLWLGVVVTDFTVHRWLVCPGADAYFVADEKLFGQIECASGHCIKNAGLQDDCPGIDVVQYQAGNEKHSETRPALYSWGIPVRGRFTEKREPAAVRQETRNRSGWPADAFVCLLAGGGDGMLPMEEIVRSMQNEKFKDIYVVAVTGHNDGLRKKLEAMQKWFLKSEANAGISRLTVLGFTDEMPQLMQAADVVITKAGGVSLAECLECGANTLIYHPLPGQEQGNTVFLQQNYGVEAVTDIRQLDDYLERERKVSLPERLQRQNARKQRYGYRAAAGRIADLTDKLRNR